MDSLHREESVRRFEPHDSAVGGGTDDGPRGLRPQRRRHHQVRHRRCGSAGGPSGRVRRVVRVTGGSRGEERQLGGDRFPEHDPARGPQRRHAGRVPRRAPAAVQRRSALGRDVGGVDDVFDPHRQAVERGRAAARVDGPGVGERLLRVEPGPGVDPWLVARDAVQTGTDQRLGGDGSVLQPVDRRRRSEFLETSRAHPSLQITKGQGPGP